MAGSEREDTETSDTNETPFDEKIGARLRELSPEQRNQIVQQIDDLNSGPNSRPMPGVGTISFSEKFLQHLKRAWKEAPASSDNDESIGGCLKTVVSTTVLTAIAVTVLYYGGESLADDVTTLTLLYACGVLAVGLLFLFLFLGGGTVFKWVTKRPLGSFKRTIMQSQTVLKAVVDRDLEATTKEGMELAATWASWKAHNYLILLAGSLLLGLLAGFAALIQASLVFHQNRLIATQNTWVEKQTKISRKQTDLLENQNRLVKEQTAQSKKQTMLLLSQNKLVSKQTAIMEDQSKKFDKQNELFEVQNKKLEKQNALATFEQANNFRKLLIQKPINKHGIPIKEYPYSSESIQYWPEPNHSVVNQIANLGRVEPELVANSLMPLLTDNNVSVSSGALLTLSYMLRQERNSDIAPTTSNIFKSFSIQRLESSHANITSATLPSINFVGFDISNLKFIGANLSRANLSRANLSGADLSGANLVRADLSRANLRKAYLRGAFLGVTNLDQTSLEKADLRKAYLVGASLVEANLSMASLSGVSLDYANLSKANLSKANLTGASLSEANLSEANLGGANLSGIKSFTIKQLVLCKDLTDIKGLSTKILHDLKERVPDKMSWWKGP